jgi:hypothetical protein
VAKVDGIDQHVDIRECRQDDAHGVGPDLRHLLQELEAGHARHALVRDDHRHLVLAQELERLVTTLRAENRERALEVEAEGIEVVLLVVDDQDRIVLGVRGHGIDLRPSGT